VSENFGFLSSPYANINLIRDNLRDRYRDGFPVVKELVQNADDAGASHLDIGWTHGLPKASHPLLQGPALFIINDGPFRDKDAFAIRQLGLSDRANEKATIGKFGLGLKSIFHLCEAFFYIASDTQAAEKDSQKYPRYSIFNPWSGGFETDIHRDWNHFSAEDRNLVATHLARFLDKEEWFCLWIPLRRQSHLGVYDAIERKYPGDNNAAPSEIFSPDVGLQLANVMPMLRHLRAIQGWVEADADADADAVFHQVFSATLGEQSRRRQYAGGVTAHGGWPLDGQLIVQTANPQGMRKSIHCTYAGEEIVLRHPVFDTLRRLDAWPRYTTIDRRTGAPQIALEKAEPHAAVYFTTLPPIGPGQLTQYTAVFLPVGDPESPIDCPGQSDVWLTLHGYYFIDAGRSRVIDGVAEGNQIKSGQDDRISPAQNLSIQAQWNQSLARMGVYPLILPALDHFMAEAQLSLSQTHTLTAALAQSPLFKDHRAFICAARQWVCCLSGEEARWQWRLLDARDRIYEIPSPPESASRRPFEVFPALRRICMEQRITIRSMARLSLHDAQPWPTNLLAQILDLPVATVFTSQSHLEYLAAFLDQQATQGIHARALSSAVIGIMRIALRTLDLPDVRKNQALMRRILRHVSPDARYHLDVDIEGNRAEILQGLLRLDTPLLLLPTEFEPDGSESTGVLDVESAVQVVSWLADVTEERRAFSGWAKMRMDIVTRLLGTLDTKRQAVLDRCAGLALFDGYRCATSGEVILTLKDLTHAFKRHMLFVYASLPNMPSSVGLARELQAALRDGDVILIRRELAALLFPAEALSPCNESACEDSLASGIPLGDPSARADLLDRLSPRLNQSPTSQRTVTAIRYLLHAEAVHVTDNGDLLVTSEGGELWARLARLALQSRADAWRVVSSHLTAKLGRYYWTHLKVKQIAVETVVGLLEECDVTTLDVHLFGRDERHEMLRCIDNLDVLKRLRIHEDVVGNVIAIDDKTFLPGEFDLPNSLVRDITLLRSISDLHEKQSCLVPILDARAAIDLVLRHEQPSIYWHTLMDALTQVSNVSIAASDTGRRLRETKWLPTIHGNVVAPNDVIAVPGLEDEVTRIVALSDGAFVDPNALLPAVLAHPASRVLMDNIFPDRLDALTVIGEIMGADERYRVGLSVSSDIDLTSFIDVFDGSPDTLMPALPLLRGVNRLLSEQDLRTTIWPKLQCPLPRGRLLNIMDYLADKHQRASRDRKQVVLDIHSQFLAVAIPREDFPAVLPHIVLLSQGGAWKSPSLLCAAGQVDGIDASDLLDARQASLIGKFTVGQGKVEDTTSQPVDDGVDEAASSLYSLADVADSGNRLNGYFEHWPVSEEAIGGFLALLGDDPAILQSANCYLGTGSRTVKNTRDLIDWSVITAAPLGNRISGFGEDIHAAMAKQRVVVRIEEQRDDVIQAPNLLGQPFTAHKALHGDLQTLLIGARDRARIPNFPFRLKILRLRTLYLCTFRDGYATKRS